VPKACPVRTVVAKALKVTVSKTWSKFTTTANRSSRTCTYDTSAGMLNGVEVSPTTIRFISPVSKASFAEQRKASSKGAAVVTVKGLGDQAFAIKRGNGLFILKGTLEVVISAPNAPDARLEALGHKLV
jgi:hypothetical protein